MQWVASAWYVDHDAGTLGDALHWTYCLANVKGLQRSKRQAGCNLVFLMFH